MAKLNELAELRGLDLPRGYDDYEVVLERNDLSNLLQPWRVTITTPSGSTLSAVGGSQQEAFIDAKYALGLR